MNEKTIEPVRRKHCGGLMDACEELKAKDDRIAALAEALEMMMRAHGELLPGLRNISCSDYLVINDAPVAARKALAPEKGKGR